MAFASKGHGALTPTETDMDLRTRVVSLEHNSTLTSQRLGELEKWQRLSDIADARKDEQLKNIVAQNEALDKKIETQNAALDKKIEGMNNNIKWVVKLIVGGLIAGLVAFIVNGGFVRAREVATAIIETSKPIMPASRPLICPSDRPVLVRSYCRGPSQSPWLGEAVLRTR